MWWPNAATFCWWAIECKAYEVGYLSSEEVDKALLNKKPPNLGYWSSAGFRLRCDFAGELESEHHAHEAVPFTLDISVPRDVISVDHMGTYARAVSHLYDVGQWLKTDPVIDGLRISQHRYRAMVEKEADDKQREAERVEQLANDPGFTPEQAKALLAEMKMEAQEIKYGGVRRQVICREGTAQAGAQKYVHAEANEYFSKSGKWTKRVVFRWDCCYGRPDSAATVRQKLMDDCSRSKTEELWEREASQ